MIVIDIIVYFKKVKKGAIIVNIYWFVMVYMKEKRRIKWYDVARLAALISIVSNHAISRVFDNYVD